MCGIIPLAACCNKLRPIADYRSFPLSLRGVSMKSLQTRLLVVVGLGLLPVLAFQIHNESDARHARKQQMEAEALRVVRAVDDGQQRIIDSAMQSVDLISRTPAVQERRVELCGTLLTNVIAGLPRYASIAVIGLDGRSICEPGAVNSQDSALGRPYFRRAVQTGGFAVGDYTISQRTGKPVLHVAKAYRTPDGKLAGVVVLALKLGWLQQQILALSLPAGAVATVADRDGNILARSPNSAMQAAGRPATVRNRQMLLGNHAQLADIVGRGGEARLAAFIPPGASPSGLLVAVSFDRASIFADVLRQNSLGEVLIVAGALLALLIAALSGLRLIRHPVQHLLDAAGRWRAGDLTARTGLRHDGSEFGRLAAAFDDMAATLADRDATLRNSEIRLRRSQEAGGVGSWEWNIDTGEYHWSDVQYRLFGLEPGAPITADCWREQVHPEDREAAGAASQAAMRGGGTFEVEYRMVTPRGVRWINARGQMHRDARGARLVGTCTDVTARRVLENELRELTRSLELRVQDEVAARETAQMRAAQAERMQALGQLSGGIAHDFNNVLQAISAGLSMIERRANEPATIQRVVRMTNEAVERGAAVTRRLLAFGRRGDLRATRIDAAGLLADLREILVHTLGAHVDVHLRLAPGVGSCIADRSQLETALINLAANARDAMPGGGVLVLAAAPDENPDRLAPGRYTRLSVEDSGTGMDEATLARAPEPFFTTKQVGVGTGLGLAMARGFAEQSGGALRIESRPGAGTTVTLWLPEAEAGADATPPPGTRPGREARAALHVRVQLLLVDDDDIVRASLAGGLEEAGFHVLAAPGGAAALAVLDGPAMDEVTAMVTDLSMPGMDGLALIRAVRHRNPGMPVLLLTGYAGSAVTLAVDQLIEEGPLALLRKPVTIEQIVDRLGVLLAMRAEAGLAGE